MVTPQFVTRKKSRRPQSIKAASNLGQLRLSFRENFIDTGAGSAQQSGVLEARVPWASTHPRRFFLWLTLIPRVRRSFPVRIYPALSSLGGLFMVRRS